MSFKRKLFSFSDSPTGSEIDLRAKFDELVYGGNGKIPHGQHVVVRNIRRDSEDKKIKCTCFDEMTQESAVHCAYCDEVGFLWDEVWHEAYATFSGSSSSSIKRSHKVFYFRYDTAIRYGDVIVEMKLDLEGKVIVPYSRVAIYTPETIQECRSDRGRIEYIAVFCNEETVCRFD